MRISVVINTYNRAGSLRTTLEALRYQTYAPFEVVVVKGPCTDATDAVLAEFSGAVRVGFCPEINLSKSRNIGIAMASGDVVAFIDDDAVPDPRWLTELAAGYNSEKVGGVGGIVYDHTGYALQYERCITDRRAEANFKVQTPLWVYNLPHGDWYVHLLGTNASFRRQCLVEIGGFDEEFEYFLDETEVCNRIIDRGYYLRLLDGAPVYHKFLASHLRNEKKVLRKPFPPVKNKFYFSLQSARPADPIQGVLKHCLGVAEDVVRGGRAHHAAGELNTAELAAFEADVDRAVRCGLAKGTYSQRQSVALPPAQAEAFHPYPALRPRRRLTVCFISQEMPPESFGGIGRFTLDLARGFAAEGHEVHFLTRTPDHNRVDFENGIWVHRLQPEQEGVWCSPELPPFLRLNLGRAAAVHREIRRIGQTRPIDLVTAPVWDAEGLLCQLDDSLTCVLTLQTTMKLMTEIDPRWKNGPEMAERLALERYTVRSARWIHAISRNILDKVQRDYGAPVEPAEAFVVRLGVADRAQEYRPRPPDGRLRVLFVGRLEKRKGVDVLLQAAIALTREHPHVEFVLVGDNTIPSDDGPTYQAAFQEKYGADPASRRVIFKGKLPDAELYQEYADCDLFCLPARYESFGLVLVEAMMFGKPVIGSAAGGMTEIVADGVNGFLATPGDLASLTGYLRRLIVDDELRQQFGRQSRRRYEMEFSAEIMVRNTMRAYTEIIDRVAAA
jgi:glycosyltransferase involved in cell wall biosynthesis